MASAETQQLKWEKEKGYVNPNQAGLFWLCYIWGGGGGGIPAPEVSAVIRAIAIKFCPGHNLHDCVVRFVKIIIIN